MKAILQFDYPYEVSSRTKKGVYIGTIFFLLLALLGFFIGCYISWYFFKTDAERIKEGVYIAVITVLSGCGVAWYMYQQKHDLKVAKLLPNGLGITTVFDKEVVIPWEEITVIKEKKEGLVVYSKGHPKYDVLETINDYKILKNNLPKYAKNAKYKKSIL